MSNLRRQRHSEELRERIIEITQQIILEQGIDAVSIRRVAQALDYTPPIIYYYFQNKDQLLSHAIQEGYRKILTSVKQPEQGLPPDEELRVSFKNFVDSAMLVPDTYKSFILNSSFRLLAETSVLEENGCAESPTLAKIVSTLETGIEIGMFLPCDVNVTAKVIWSAMFGLFFRLVVENQIPDEQRNTLIQRQIDVILKGIAA